MKITFVYPDLQPQVKFWKGHYYSGIAYLSSYLESYEHKTSLIHVCHPMSKEAFIQRVVDENPDIIGFSSTSHAFSVVKKLAAWIKEENLRIPVVCGGIHPTISPDESINTEGIDMICRGEGEEPLAELCKSINEGDFTCKIPNIWFKTKDGIHKNPLRPPYQDINTLPAPNRKIFEYKDLYHESQGYGTVMMSRGCPFQCNYCCNHALRNLYDKNVKYTRFRSVDNAISEIKQIKKDFSFIKAIHFDDDNLFLNRKWGETFMSRYKDEVALPFDCNVRPNLLGKKKADQMSKAGCHQVSIGLESGNDYIRNDILNRNLSREHIIRAFKLCKDAKIRVKSFNMVGLPHEDTGAVIDTIKLNALIETDVVQVTISRPYNGTRLYDLCMEKKFLTNKDIGVSFFSESPLALDSISPEQIMMFRNYFKIFVKTYQKFYELPKGISGFFIKVSDGVLSSKLVSKLLNIIFIPLNISFRLMQYAKWRVSKIQ